MQRIISFCIALLTLTLAQGFPENKPVTQYVVAEVYQKEVTVYITKTGEKYHRGNCRYLSRSKISTTKKDAIKNGYGACKVCKP